MTPTILLLPLLAAILHASWNALVKTAADRLTILSAIALVTGLTGAVMVAVFPSPRPESWLFIAASISTKYVYYVLMFFAYKTGDLSFVYPIARGVAPLLVALGAAFLADEVPSRGAFLGIAMVSMGIFWLTFSNRSIVRADPSAVLLPAAIGIAIATFSLCDGIGVRASASPFGFMGWLFLLEAPIVAFAAIRRRKVLWSTLSEGWLHGLAAGLSSVLAYALVVYAAAFAPLALVSAMRETSVVIAAVIGSIVLREGAVRNRIAASAVVASGVCVIIIFY